MDCADFVGHPIYFPSCFGVKRACNICCAMFTALVFTVNLWMRCIYIHWHGARRTLYVRLFQVLRGTQYSGYSKKIPIFIHILDLIETYASASLWDVRAAQQTHVAAFPRMKNHSLGATIYGIADDPARESETFSRRKMRNRVRRRR